MNNKYRTYSRYNPLPWKTEYSNKFEWSSLEEALSYAAVRSKRYRKRQIEKVYKED